jgi:hypothetical protein
MKNDVLTLEHTGFFCLVFFGAVRLAPLGTTATIWPIVPTRNDS